MSPKLAMAAAVIIAPFLAGCADGVPQHAHGPETGKANFLAGLEAACLPIVRAEGIPMRDCVQRVARSRYGVDTPE